jgi:hypothetical protein
VNDPGSLQNLNDIVVPDPVAWWPPAPGWYFVLAVLAVFLLWISFRGLRRWRRNTYRRQALRELADIDRAGPGAAAGIPVLLKRAALSAWTRPEVARLSGPEWHQFLDRTAGTDRFRAGGAGALMDRLAYAGRAGMALSADEFRQLHGAAEFWLKNHRPEAAAP